MQLSDITILIPTIGRDSIFDAINSIPTECKILVALDSKCGNHILKYNESHRLLTKGHNYAYITDLFIVNYQCAGLTKAYLISKVKTEWFMILDDDDYLLPGTLNRFVQAINTSKVIGHDPKWISTHYCHESDVQRKLSWTEDYLKTNDPLDVIKSFDEFKSKYWEWIDGVRTDEYTLNHIYPCSEILMSTHEFHQMVNINPELNFKIHLLDDVIPTLTFMTMYSGINDINWGIAYTTPSESVSRSPRIHPALDLEFNNLVRYLYSKYLDTHESLWLTALTNMLHVTNYNLIKYQNE